MCTIYTKRRHISASIRGLAAMTDPQLDEMAAHIRVDGKPLCCAAQVRSFLDEILAEGFEYIPADGCDNFDSKGLCLGHEIKTEEGKHE